MSSEQPDFLTSFSEGQWWVRELDHFAFSLYHTATPDQQRAVAVVHHLLRSIQAYAPKPGTWTIVAPDGRQWTGESALVAARAAQRDTIDPVIAMERINAMVAEETAIHDAELALEYQKGWQSAVEHFGLKPVLPHLANMMLELAQIWDLQASSGGDGLNALTHPAARETLRACADTLHMVVQASKVGMPAWDGATRKDPK